ncbi:hypothetical protein ACFWSJ_13175 [Streptomyces niveus]|uniref:hypothetical protein n=1 Tax=Streptomyces niveus TaxID=193462 RepID=UPI003654BE81
MRLLCTSTVRRLGALITITALTWLFAPGAVAGGPTSVLITSPESAESASLYFSDVEYEALSKQLDGQDMGALPEGQEKRPAAVDSAVGSRQINVTWMIHDVQPWRLDQVYPSADVSTVWIHTSTDIQGIQTGVWHKAKQPAALRALLKRIGVMGEKKGHGVAVPPADETDSAVAEETPVAEEAQPVASGASAGGTDGWWWAIPALGAGVVLGLVLRPLAGRLPRPPFGSGGNGPEAGPRRQLLDM